MIDFQMIIENKKLTKEDINLQFENEINNIKNEIVNMFENDTETLMKNSSLVNRINACLNVLQRASENLKYRKAIKVMNNKEKLIKASCGSDARNNTERKIADARSIIQEAKNDIKTRANNAELKAALMEGYSLVNLIREYIIGETIDYKVMSIGTSNGNDTILEANLTLAQILQSAELENTASGIALKITETKQQFERVLKAVDQQQEINKFNTVLNKMERVQLDAGERNLWKVFVRLKEKLDNVTEVKGVKLNYGNLAESFMTSIIEDMEVNVENIYDLLEKGRNNLAYYLGGDIQNIQVKALTTYGKKGRADVATLSNVINPLTEIRNILTSVDSKDIKNKLEELFTPSSGQGDRPFSEELKPIIMNKIKESINEQLLDKF